VYHHIVAHIERAIYDGRLECGDKLPPERELGRRFGASRVAVREALRALEHRGLLEVRPDVARLAAERATDLQIKSLRAALDERFAVVAGGRNPRELDLDFHRRLAAMSRNPIHAVTIHALIDVEADTVAPHGLYAEADRAEVERAHTALLEAVEARDGDRARAVMQAHIADMQRRVAAQSGS
jgi:GntR family transcriptional repressor for pyruvate dehydrogenase complex